MTADASPGIAAAGSVGADIGLIVPVGVGLLLFGLLLLGAAAVLVGSALGSPPVALAV